MFPILFGLLVSFLNQALAFNTRLTLPRLVGRIPMTRVFGTNSLWCESFRDAGDLAPFEADVGNYVRFYGNQCWHRVLPNETEGLYSEDVSSCAH